MIINVRPSPLDPYKGLLSIAGTTFLCALGQSGMKTNKREGDGATPIGHWPLRYVLYRPDQAPRPTTALPVKPIKQNDGWCDTPGDPNYNRPVPLPYKTGAENLWRDDEIYNLIIVTGHNETPRTQGLGSAIFIHIAKPGYTPTKGCIALHPKHLYRILKHVNHNTLIKTSL